MYARSLSGNREVSGLISRWYLAGPHREGEEPKPMMNGSEKSDSALVAMKPANQAGDPVAERVEQRAGTKGNMGQSRTRRTPSRSSVSPGLERVRQAANLPSLTQGRSPVRELRSLGSVRGVSGNRYPYRDSVLIAAVRVFNLNTHFDPIRTKSPLLGARLTLCLTTWFS